MLPYMPLRTLQYCKGSTNFVLKNIQVLRQYKVHAYRHLLILIPHLPCCPPKDVCLIIYDYSTKPFFFWKLIFFDRRQLYSVEFLYLPLSSFFTSAIALFSIC